MVVLNLPENHGYAVRMNTPQDKTPYSTLGKPTGYIVQEFLSIM